MPLPDLIEIVPLTEPVHAEITVPGSKSITNRALVLAALADGEVTLKHALWSEDTQVMVDCLQDLGYMVNVAPDESEFCNRTITVYGKGDSVPRGGTEAQPLELFVGNAGTAARFLSALVCLGDGVYRLHGIDRMHERPQAALFKALRELGYRIDSSNDKLPALIHGDGLRRGAECTVSIEESSQFASALMLAGSVGRWNVNVVGENAEESPYVRMTSELVKVFPDRGGEFEIEPDASSGSYFWAAGWVLYDFESTAVRRDMLSQPNPKHELSADEVFEKYSGLEVCGWPRSGWQLDSDFVTYLRARRVCLPSEVSRLNDLADSIMTAIVVAPMHAIDIKFTDLGRLRVQECERVVALRTELTKCGAKVEEVGDTLTVYPSTLHGAEIETYNDHRMAMCFGVLGLKVPGMKIRNPACVKKTFPNFWQKLAAAPPQGLGAKILDANTGKELGHDELFAD